mgnify:CR=1 FL=1
MSLAEKLKKMGKALGIAGMLASPVYNSGCEALVIGGANVWAAEKRAQAERDAAEINAQATRDAAAINAQSKENFARIQNQNSSKNTGINQQNSPQISEKEPIEEYYFTCNEIKDLDGNGRFDYPYDFKNIRKNVGKFYVGENIAVVGRMLDPRMHDNNIELIVIDSNNNLIYKDRKYINFELKQKDIVRLGLLRQDILCFEDNPIQSKSKPGEYKAYWTIPSRGIVLGEIKYKILERENLK